MLRIPLRGLICLDQAESTHMLLKSQEYADLEPYTMVMARRQTKGRGQRGNSWESEDGKNLTFSMKARPDWLHPSRQFAISEATSIAIVTLLKEYGIAASVKWPNDIYVGHRKICGILIDHSLQGMEITGSVISAGLNVNQIRFLSDAPNPVSMLQLLPPGSPEIPIEKIARRAGELICGMLEETVQPVSHQGSDIYPPHPYGTLNKQIHISNQHKRSPNIRKLQKKLLILQCEKESGSSMTG